MNVYKDWVRLKQPGFLTAPIYNNKSDAEGSSHWLFCRNLTSKWAKNRHASQIGCRVAPFWIHWACLTTAECPCLGLYAREMPGFLSPLLLLLLPFTYSLAAQNHFAKRLICIQWEESPPPSCPPDQLGLCICPQLWWGPHAATSSVSQLFDRLGSCLISTCAQRADGPKFTLAGLSRGSYWWFHLKKNYYVRTKTGLEPPEHKILTQYKS